ncbi:DUF3307 domain-containing protein [Lachnoclostridium phytofermentans]|uniref:DUF3307 domain-containing protein n=1 Tax=Lachnoclostridium phytofermentans TaxID=66219 RepID=UPI000495118B|nr:DUF3307 domain-containing protein [Lachnoclostridium phytofermentans]
MNIKIMILLSMIFLHIVDDYYLQGWLASAKQKSWWEKNAPDKLYKHDYIIALFMHSFSWAYMITLVPTLYIVLFGGKWYPILFMGNVLIHMVVDDMKANKKKINLIQDQSIHMLQILWTWVCYLN